MSFISACAPVTQEPQISDTELDKEAELQKSLAEEWVLEYELSLQKKLLAKAYITNPDPRDENDYSSRVYDIWHRLVTANAPLCAENIAPTIGAFTIMKTRKNETAPWAKPLKLSRSHPTVRIIANNSPAQDAGLKIGDKIISVNDHRIQTGKDLISNLRIGKPIPLTFVRGTTFKTITITPKRGCNYGVGLEKTPLVNAYADGKNVVIYSGLIDFAKSDDEVALILGHELAHNMMLHVPKAYINTSIGYIVGHILDTAAGALIFGNTLSPNVGKIVGARLGSRFESQGFESEADYVGIYLTARAQYDVSNVADFWRRRAIEAPSGIDPEWNTHPNYTERYLVLTKTVQELQDKLETKQPIIPNLLHGNDDVKPRDIAPQL